MNWGLKKQNTISPNNEKEMFAKYMQAFTSPGLREELSLSQTVAVVCEAQFVRAVFVSAVSGFVANSC